MRTWCILALLTFQLPALCQLSIEHSSFKINNLGQILAISNQGLDLYDSKGALIQHYSEDLLGDVSTIDRSSSLESLIFYRDIPGFQLLDNTLSPHSPLYDLNKAGYENVTAVCISNDNTFWAYDAVNFEVFRFDDRFQLLERSGNLAVVIGQDIEPLSMMISNNRLYIADKAIGVLVFDFFASHLLTIPFEKDISDMDVTENWIYVSTDFSVIRIDKKGMAQQVWSTVDHSIVCFDIEIGNLFWGDGKTIFQRDLNSLFD